MLSSPKNFNLFFIRKEKIARDTYSFYFDLKQEKDFYFTAGQYIRMLLDIENPDDRGSSRFFTISSSPLEKDYLTITTKIIKSSFKNKLLELNSGDSAKFYGPMGSFVLNENIGDERVFLAGGIGITPFHSMIKYAYKKNLSIPLTLFVSFSGAEDVIFYKELSEIASKNPNIKVIYTITHAQENSNWRGETGRISEEMLKKYIKDINKPLYYIVGPPSMVVGMEDMVSKMGIPNEKIFIENFTGY